MIFHDALYGKIDLQIPGKVLNLPELQRLREIRLCNINSPFITGGSNLNRFEHAIGTGYLAQILTANNPLFRKDTHNFIVAALLHDVVTSPFGHSLEYIFSALGKNHYEHSNLDTIFTGKTVQNSRPFYCGKKSMLATSGDLFDVSQVHNILTNSHNTSRYLSSEIDIDNIDNVFRFAFHIGIQFTPSTPTNLAIKLDYTNDKLNVEKDDIHLFQEWFDTRSKLYNLLLENEGEFVSKALLERLFIELINSNLITEIDWILTDSDVISVALTRGVESAKQCAQKLMTMDFPSKHIIAEIHDFKSVDSFLKMNHIQCINYFYAKNIYVHFIRDVNKTLRPLNCLISDKQNIIGEHKIGAQNDRFLVGIFSDHTSAVNSTLEELKSMIGTSISPLRGLSANEQKQFSLF